MRSYFTISGSPLTEAIGAHALAHAPAILQRLREVAHAQSRAAHAIHGRASRRARLGAARRRHDVFPVVARWARCAPAVRGAGEGGRAGGARATASTCRRTCAWDSARCAAAMRTRSRSSAACSRGSSYQSSGRGGFLCEIVPPGRGGRSRGAAAARRVRRPAALIELCSDGIRKCVTAHFCCSLPSHEHALDHFQHLHHRIAWAPASRCCRGETRACRAPR